MLTVLASLFTPPRTVAVATGSEYVPAGVVYVPAWLRKELADPVLTGKTCDESTLRVNAGVAPPLDVP